jgi:hypothetical protein
MIAFSSVPKPAITAMILKQEERVWNPKDPKRRFSSG